MEKAVKKDLIPRTDSIQELAEFWDTHDSTDYEDELVEVTEPVFERSTAIEVRLQPGEAEAVRELARAQGVTQEQLIHEWVRQKLARPKARSSGKMRPAAPQKRAGTK
jgi:predicted DNA binding CopG/RHH family protein